ncbi:MAG: hypothetical protein HY308_15915 [Gammaproteobacteria bacterium]|nr:hypothetical protein [Gammaproteobacteria bacterium]
MTTPSERELIETAGRLLRQTEHELDPLTIARLRAARRRALDHAGRRPRFSRFAMGGLVTAGVTFALVGIISLTAPTKPIASETTVADLELLTTENPEFYEDLEFYDWLGNAS